MSNTMITNITVVRIVFAYWYVQISSRTNIDKIKYWWFTQNRDDFGSTVLGADYTELAASQSKYTTERPMTIINEER